MIELWVGLTLVSAFLWAIVSLIDKFVLSHEMQDPILATIVAGISIFIVFVFYSIFTGTMIFNPLYIIGIALLAGVSYNFAIYFYYSAVKKGEVSRVTSFLAFIPIFVLIFAYLFLNERLDFLNYLGIFLVVSGSFLISIKKERREYNLSAALLAAVIAALFFAFRDFFIKLATIQTEIWSLFFWIGIGSGLTALLFLFAHHPHIRKKAKSGLKHIFLGRILSAIALLVFSIAIALASVSLVSALVRVNIIIVFLSVTAISHFHPSFLKEEITPLIFVQKSLSIILIFVGAFLLV